MSPILLDSLFPNLMVEDVSRAVHFYTAILGFQIRFVVESNNTDVSQVNTTLTEGVHYSYAHVFHGAITIALQERNSMVEDAPSMANLPIGASATLYIRMKNLDAFYARCNHQVHTLKPIQNNWYGMREWYIRDCDGYVLVFGEMIE